MPDEGVGHLIPDEYSGGGSERDFASGHVIPDELFWQDPAALAGLDSRLPGAPVYPATTTTVPVVADDPALHPAALAGLGDGAAPAPLAVPVAVVPVERGANAFVALGGPTTALSTLTVHQVLNEEPRPDWVDWWAQMFQRWTILAQDWLAMWLSCSKTPTST